MKKTIKNLLFTSTLFLIVNFSFAQTKIGGPFFGDEVLKGKVSFFSDSTYNFVEKFGEIEKGGRRCNFKYKYDEKGNKIEGHEYPNLYDHDDFKCDEKGNKIEGTKFDVNRDRGSYEYKYTYKYDEKGNMIEENYYKSSELNYKSKYKYDEKGNKIEENWYNSAGGLWYKLTYKYDVKGNKIEQINNNADGSLFYKYTYKYDVKGNKIEENINRKYTYKYDVKGNMIEFNGSNADGSLVRRTYKYDVKGNIIEMNDYNDDGSLRDKKTCKFEVEFDRMGNWIKKTLIKDGKPEYLTERVIEYY